MVAAIASAASWTNCNACTLNDTLGADMEQRAAIEWHAEASDIHTCVKSDLHNATSNFAFDIGFEEQLCTFEVRAAAE